jgi:hypothetical protein
MIRRLLDSPNHLEGEPFGLPSIVALKLLLLFIRPLDDLIPDKSRSDQDGLRKRLGPVDTLATEDIFTDEINPANTKTSLAASTP